MRVRNIGPTALTVPCMGGADIEFPVGEPVEVPEHVGQQLVEQPVFQPVETRDGSTPKPRAKARRPKES